MYLLKNSFIISIGLLLSYVLLNFNLYFQLSTMPLTNYYLHFFENEYVNVIIFICIYFIIYFIFSLLNYLIYSYEFTNYYSFILALVISSIHAFILYSNNIEIDIESFFSLISIQIFLSFFINYSTKYEKSNNILIKDTF